MEIEYVFELLTKIKKPKGANDIYTISYNTAVEEAKRDLGVHLDLMTLFGVANKYKRRIVTDSDPEIVRARRDAYNDVAQLIRSFMKFYIDNKLR